GSDRAESGEKCPPSAYRIDLSRPLARASALSRHEGGPLLPRLWWNVTAGLRSTPTDRGLPLPLVRPRDRPDASRVGRPRLIAPASYDRRRALPPVVAAAPGFARRAGRTDRGRALSSLRLCPRRARLLRPDDPRTVRGVEPPPSRGLGWGRVPRGV